MTTLSKKRIIERVQGIEKRNKNKFLYVSRLGSPTKEYFLQAPTLWNESVEAFFFVVVHSAAKL
jgi:hypothetical protein